MHVAIKLWNRTVEAENIKFTTFISSSGEAAYKSLSFSLGWAKNPMLHRIKDLSREVPITFVYGSRSWMDSECGYQTKDLRKGSYVDVQVCL